MLEPRAFMDQGSLPSQSVKHPWTLQGVTSDLRLVLDEWRARVAELHLPKFRNERFPSPRQIYNQGWGLSPPSPVIRSGPRLHHHSSLRENEDSSCRRGYGNVFEVRGHCNSLSTWQARRWLRSDHYTMERRGCWMHAFFRVSGTSSTRAHQTSPNPFAFSPYITLFHALIQTDISWPRLLKRWIALSDGQISIHWITQLVFQILIRWIVIYPVYSTIQLMNNPGLQCFICHNKNISCFSTACPYNGIIFLISFSCFHSHWSSRLPSYPGFVHVYVKDPVLSVGNTCQRGRHFCYQNNETITQYE